jgi:RES domain-containing protein
MEVFRLTRAKYAKTLSGKGASLFGNRWNSKGVEMIYTSESRALAMAEVLVHLSLNQVPGDYKMICIDIPNSIKFKTISTKALPSLWHKFPHGSNTQNIGDEFIMNNTLCVLKVPSAVVYGDYNYLINPYHKDFKQIKIKSLSSFPIDDRFLV